MNKNKQIAVCTRSKKSQMEELIGKAVKLGPRGLFQTINGFVQETDMMRLRDILIPKWLTHVNLLLQHSMKKGIRNI